MSYNQGGPSQVSYPWRAVWDQRENGYIYENEQTGHRQPYPPSQQGGGYAPQTSQHGSSGAQTSRGYGGPPPQSYGGSPQSYGGSPQGYGGPPQSYGGGPPHGYSGGPPQGYGGPPQGYAGGPPGGYGTASGYGAAPPQTLTTAAKQSHNYGGMALAGAGGLVAGALLMHEGEKLHEDWDQDKYRMENRAEEFGDRARYDVDEVRDDARYEEGRVEQRWDDGRDDVRDEVRYEERREEERYDDVREDVRYDERRAEERFDEGRDETAYEAGRQDGAYEERREDYYEERRDDDY